MSQDEVAWVRWIEEQDATGDVAAAYAAVAAADGQVENLYKAMSLTPGVIGPADAHYLALLHNPASPLRPWFSELVATYVSILCGSRYAVLNHGENFEHYFGDRQISGRILDELHKGVFDEAIPEDVRAALAYARKLSLSPQDMSRQDIDDLRQAGFCDTEISYIAQIAASFAYWARITNSLGIAPGDRVGLTDKPLDGA